MNLFSMIHGDAGAAEIGAYLDDLSHQHRLEETMTLKKASLEALFRKVKGARSLTLAHFVPETVEDMREVIHWGRNSLPAFVHFQKRFCRPPTESRVGDVLWGYNEQKMKRFTGPGYFTTREGMADTPVWIDYRGAPPPARLATWPEILPNRKRLARVVYYETVDRMRGVSEHVSIGSAFRGEAEIGAFFVLCREDR